MAPIVSHPRFGPVWAPAEDELIEQRVRCLMAARLAIYLGEADLVSSLVDEAWRYHKALLYSINARRWEYIAVSSVAVQ